MSSLEAQIKSAKKAIGQNTKQINWMKRHLQETKRQLQNTSDRRNRQRRELTALLNQQLKKAKKRERRHKTHKSVPIAIPGLFMYLYTYSLKLKYFQYNI